MYIESTLSYNNKYYGRGKAYIAKIVGKSNTYGFEREFLYRFRKSNYGSSTVWYGYNWKLEESGLYEIHEENAYKTKREYYIYDKESDEISEISQLEALEYVEDFIIGTK